MTKIRSAFTRLLIRIAMKTCVYGFCLDHLQMAYKYESRSNPFQKATDE